MTVFKYLKRNHTIADQFSYIKSEKKRKEMELILTNWKISIKPLEVYLIAVIPAFIIVFIGLYIKQTMYTPIKILSQKYFFTWKDKTFSADY